jgi:hypothetical protein
MYANMRSFVKYFTDLQWYIIYIISFAYGLNLLIAGPEFGSDTYGYLRMEIFRPIGYPLFLNLMEIFGEYQAISIIFLQIVFNLIIGVYFLKNINTIFSYGLFGNMSVFAMFLFTLHYYAEPSVILTEAIAFPLFLLVSINLIRSVIYHSNKYLYRACLFSFVLILVREQFLIIFPILIFLYIYNNIFIYRYKISIKNILFFITLVIIIPVFASVINKTYHLVNHNTFSTPHNNVSIFPTLAYSSNLNDSLLIDNSEIRKSFVDIYKLLDSQGLTMDYFYENIYYELPPNERRRRVLIYHYHDNFENIQKVVRNYYGQGEKTNLKHLKMESDINIMTSHLLKEHYPSFIYLNLSDIFVYAFDSKRSHLGLFILIFLTSFLALVARNKFGIVAFTFLSLHILNLLASSISIKIIPRYTYYTNFILSVLLLIVLINYMYQRNFD